MNSNEAWFQHVSAMEHGLTYNFGDTDLFMCPAWTIIKSLAQNETHTHTEASMPHFFWNNVDLQDVCQAHWPLLAIFRMFVAVGS